MRHGTQRWQSWQGREGCLVVRLVFAMVRPIVWAKEECGSTEGEAHSSSHTQVLLLHFLLSLSLSPLLSSISRFSTSRISRGQTQRMVREGSKRKRSGVKGRKVSLLLK